MLDNRVHLLQLRIRVLNGTGKHRQQHTNVNTTQLDTHLSTFTKSRVCITICPHMYNHKSAFGRSWACSSRTASVVGRSTLCILSTAILTNYLHSLQSPFPGNHHKKLTPTMDFFTDFPSLVHSIHESGRDKQIGHDGLDCSYWQGIARILSNT